MMYAVQFENDPETVAAQQRHRDAHRTYLAAHAKRLSVAGDLGRDGSEEVTGALWVVRADSELEVRELVEGDPYFVHGVRRTIRVWRFHPVPLSA